MQASGYGRCCPHCFHPYQTWLLGCQGKISKCRRCNSSKCNVLYSYTTLAEDVHPKVKRERMTNETRCKRTAAYETRKDKLFRKRQRKNSAASTSATVFTFLPPEVRLMIYGHVFGPPGEVIVSSSETKYINVDQDALVLQHVCKAFREEITDYFYTTYKIVYANKYTLDLWIQRFPDRLRKMSHICVPVKGLQLIVDSAELFQGLTRLDVDLSIIRTQRDYYTLCNKMYLHNFSLKQTPMLVIMRSLEQISRVLPAFSPSVTATPFHYKYPATMYPEPRLQIKGKNAKDDNTLRPPRLPNGYTRKDYCNRWEWSGVADLTAAIDRVVGHISDTMNDADEWNAVSSSIEKSWFATPSSDRYNTFEDFVKHHLGRSMPNQAHPD